MGRAILVLYFILASSHIFAGIPCIEWIGDFFTKVEQLHTDHETNSFLKEERKFGILIKKTFRKYYNQEDLTDVFFHLSKKRQNELIKANDDLIIELQNVLALHGVDSRVVSYEIKGRSPNHIIEARMLDLTSATVNRGWGKLLFRLKELTNTESIFVAPLETALEQSRGFLNYKGPTITLSAQVFEKIVQTKVIDDTILHELRHALFQKNRLLNRSSPFNIIWASTTRPLPVIDAGYHFFISGEELSTYAHQLWWTMKAKPEGLSFKLQNKIVKDLEVQIKDIDLIFSKFSELALQSYQQLSKIIDTYPFMKAPSFASGDEEGAFAIKLENFSLKFFPSSELYDEYLTNQKSSQIEEVKIQILKEITDKMYLLMPATGRLKSELQIIKKMMQTLKEKRSELSEEAFLIEWNKLRVKVKELARIVRELDSPF